MASEAAAPAGSELQPEGAAPRPQLRLNFPLEPGTEICLVRSRNVEPSWVSLPALSANLPEGQRLVSRSYQESQRLAALKDRTAYPSDLVSVSYSFQVPFPSGVTFEILEVGQGDQEGLVKLRNPGFEAFWVEARSLQGDWQVNRREGKPLTGARRNEILDPESDAVLRRTDDVRTFMIATLKEEFANRQLDA